MEAHQRKFAPGNPGFRRPGDNKVRWALSPSESLAVCNSSDELVAYVDVDTGWGSAERVGIIVYRTGYATDIFDDGGVTQSGFKGRMLLRRLAYRTEVLLHPNGEETSEWRTVWVDDNGKYVCDTEEEWKRYQREKQAQQTILNAAYRREHRAKK